MPQPDDGPTDLEAVKLQAGLQDNDDTDDAYLSDLIVPAVNDVVRALPIAQAVEAPADWPARVVMGASMLAARLYRRRNSPAGVEAMTDQGAAYVTRNDPDVAQLLQLGAYQKPMVG